MYFTEPSYADGIGKGKQTKFGGLNHNEGAGDGELFAMKNLCSDYYPLIATRKKRRKLRTLTKPNGIYAWEKLCWVDGTTFYYDGVAKGTVEDSRKQFAAINDIIIIMPDKKYYDTAEDRFGDLEAEVGAQSPGGGGYIVAYPTEEEILFNHGVAKYEWTNRAFGSNNIINLELAGVTFENNRITGLSGEVTANFGNLDPYLGEYVFIRGIDDPLTGIALKLIRYSTAGGWIEFDSGSVQIKDGTYEHRSGWSPFIASSRMINITFREQSTEPEHTIFDGSKEIDPTSGSYNVNVRWSDIFGVGDYLSISAPETSDGSGFSNAAVKVTGYYKRTSGGTETVIGLSADELFGLDHSIDMRVGVNDIREAKIEVLAMPKVIFRDGTLEGETAAANTIYLEGMRWEDDWHLVAGDSIEIIGSSFEIEREEDGETVTETVSNDGVYRIREVDGHELRFDADSFVNGEDDSSGTFYANWVKTARLDGEGIHFKVTHSSAVFFEEDSIHCRLRRNGYEFDWPDTDLGEGVLVRIEEDCSIEENRKTLMLRSVEEQDLGFDEGSFTEGIDKDGISLQIMHKHPVEFRDGTLYGEAAEANTVYCNSVIWSDYFRVGDTITITGCTIPLNNQTLIIRELDGHEMRFYENTFNKGIDTGDTILIKRNLPDLECVFENDNRLWGYAGKAIYASKLGDPFNFYVYDGLDTDSYAVDTGSPGNFTGGWSYMGYPTFLKGRNVYKVYGNKPSNYEVMNAATLGLMSGGGKSLAIAGETLFYLGECGIIMYTGGIPTPINRAFGQERYRNAVAGSDGLKYYVSMEDRQGTWHLFVYDTQKGMWHEEDNTEAVGFAYLDGQLYMLDSEGNFTTEGYVREEAGEEEEDFEWYAEFTDFTDDSPNKKEVHKVQIRIDLEEDATCRVKLQMDGDGEWIVPQDGVIEGGSKRSYTLAIVPRRADFYKLRLEGQGGCKIYSIARQYSEGSELKSRPGRQ